jgi:hypothetical protein
MLNETEGGAKPPKSMRLRYAGSCLRCGIALPAGTTAEYDPNGRTVRCLDCVGEVESVEAGSVAPLQESRDPLDVAPGTAGASAQREHDRRSAKRDARVRAAHPKIGGLLLAVTDDPQSTKAWAVGAAGEQRLGRRLDGLVSESIRVLHDRRPPRQKANIDHIVVCPTGVFVIDAKKWKGRPSLRVEGGIFSARREKLVVGSRNATDAVTGAIGQVAKVRAALKSAGLGSVPVSGMLCFVDADWPLIGGDFAIQEIRVLWPRKASVLIQKPGLLDAELIDMTYRALAEAFIPA